MHMTNPPPPEENLFKALGEVFERYGIDPLHATTYARAGRGIMEGRIFNEIADRALALAKANPAYMDLADESMADVLERPDEPIQWRIEYLLQVDHNTTIAAPAKTGKTVLNVNVWRALLDNDPLFGRFGVLTPMDGNLGVFNHELSPRQMHSWVRRANIKNADRLFIKNLRGTGFYLQDDDACAWAVEWLKSHEVEVWCIDPLQAALRGTVNSDEVAAEWIGRVEQVKAEAGVKDLILTTHTGHLSKADETGQASNERTIGSARWMGWPDNMWVYVTGLEDVRHLRATGRDVDMPEFGLSFDERTLRLTDMGKGTSRYAVKQSRASKAILDAFKVDPAQTIVKSEIERLAAPVPPAEVRKALAEMSSGDEALLEKSKAERPVEQKRGPAPDAYCLSTYGRWALRENPETLTNPD